MSYGIRIPKSVGKYPDTAITKDELESEGVKVINEWHEQQGTKPDPRVRDHMETGLVVAEALIKELRGEFFNVSINGHVQQTYPDGSKDSPDYINVAINAVDKRHVEEPKEAEVPTA